MGAYLLRDGTTFLGSSASVMECKLEKPSLEKGSTTDRNIDISSVIMPTKHYGDVDFDEALTDFDYYNYS